MGSSGSKPRKEQHHLAKVGTPANQAYENKARKSYLGGPLIWVVGVVLLLCLVAWLLLTI